MTAEMLDAGKDFGRYLDVDGDGIPFRTYPGTHPSKGGYFTRGTSKNAYAIYSEQGPDYKANMQRLLKKFETAKTLVPKPVLNASKEPARFGAIYYGSTGPAIAEAPHPPPPPPPPPPDSAKEQGRLPPPRLRRQGLDAVRRLRA